MNSPAWTWLLVWVLGLCGAASAQGDDIQEEVDRWIAESEFGTGEQVLRKRLEIAPEDARLQYFLGRLIAAHAASTGFQASTPAGLVKTRFAEAASLLERSLEKEVPPDGRLRCAEAYYWATDGDRAHATLTPLLDRGDGEAWQLEGDIRGYISQDWDAAIEAYLKAESADPAPSSVALKIADAEARRGDLERAIEALERQLVRTPADPAVYERIWNWLVVRQEYSKAIGLYGAALNVDPTSFLALFHLGIVKRETQDYDAAAEILDRALAIRPDSGEVRYYRALVEYSRSNYGDAAKRATEVLGSQPDHIGAREIIRTIAGFHGSRREYAAALALLEKLKGDSVDVSLWMDIALTLKHLGRESEAEEAYLNAAEADPLAGAPWNDLGILQHARGRVLEAVSAYRRAVETGLDIENSLENLAILSLQPSSSVTLKEGDAALTRLLKLDPGRARARYYLERLRRLRRESE